MHNTSNKAQFQCSTADLRTFLLAGRAVVTLKSLKTQEHFTFMILQDGRKPPPSRLWHVKVLSGPSRYFSIGAIYEDRRWVFARPVKWTSEYESKSFTAFRWFWTGVQKNLPIPQHLLEVWHEGKCGRCNRPLTHPDSIASGIGPECRELMAGERTLQEF